MAFTAGYKVNEGTQYEFTVSNETIQEMVQASDTGIGEADLGPYCYSALIDSRVYQLRAAQGNFGWPGQTGATFAGMAKESCPGIVEGWSEPMTSEHPAFNKDLLDNSDVVYQRNFLVWNGTIYPGTKNEKTGDFLIMDIKDIKRWYVNFDNNGFGETDVTSAIGEEAPEGYVWPGYTGHIYTYISNVLGQGPVMHCDNNDPHLNPNTNIRVRNILVINDEYWIGSFNPSTHCNDYMGGSGCAYAGKSLYAYYWNGGSNGGYLTTSGGMDDTYYQRGSMDFMGLPDYSNAPELPGAPRDDIGSLGYNCYAVTNSDSIVVNLAGNWGQQNYASGCNFVNNSATTQLTSVLKWQSWCGLKFQYQDTMYKPIIEGGIVVGYSDDMDAKSEYDDMTNVTGNNIPITPPGPTPPGPSGDDPWHGVDFGGTGAGGGGAFCSVYYMTGAELTSLKNWNITKAPENFDMLPSIIGLHQLPVALSGIPTTVKFLKSGAATPDARLVDTGVSAGTGTGQPFSFSLGSVDINRRMQQRGEPYLDYDCTVELFLPFAGTFVLDTQAVMGRTINAQIIIDPVNGTCFSYAWVSQGGQKMPIAYGSGSIAVDLPITSNQHAMARAAMNRVLTEWAVNTIKDVGQIIIGGKIKKQGKNAAVVGNRTQGYTSLNVSESVQAQQIGQQMQMQAGTSAAGNLGSGIVSALQINNTNYTAVHGSFGGSYAEWAQPFTAYVRITRPKFKKPSNFNHTQAVPCVETKTLGSCSGLTYCVNPDCGSLSCTEAEKIMIADALMGGVYAGGGQ